MKCDICKSKLDYIYRVWNWIEDGGDMWFETLKEAEKCYVKYLKSSAGMDWRLYEHIYCPKCEEYVEENCIDGEFIGDKYLQGELTKKVLQIK